MQFHRWHQQQHRRVSHLEEVTWVEREIAVRQDPAADSNSSCKTRISILDALLGF